VHVSGVLQCPSVFAATGLKYDVLLLHADSDLTNEYGSMLYRKLTELSRTAYSVFHYSGDDVTPGTGMIIQSFVMLTFVGHTDHVQVHAYPTTDKLVLLPD